MALVTAETRKLVLNTNQPGNVHWNALYGISDVVPVSGIYRCEECGHGITSIHPDRFPPQNKHQHSNVRRDARTLTLHLQGCRQILGLSRLSAQWRAPKSNIGERHCLEWIRLGRS